MAIAFFDMITAAAARLLMSERKASGAKDGCAMENSSQQAPLDMKVTLRLWRGIFSAGVFVPPERPRTGLRVRLGYSAKRNAIEKKGGHPSQTGRGF
jgi:hypothetical protein